MWSRPNRSCSVIMSTRFSVFEIFLEKRGRNWLWSICTTEGARVMAGSRGSRSAARYEASRAFFLLLLNAPYRLGRSAPAFQAPHVARSGRSLPTRL